MGNNCSPGCCFACWKSCICVKKTRGTDYKRDNPHMFDGKVYGISKEECVANGGSSPAADDGCTPPASFKIFEDKIYGISERLCTKYDGEWLADIDACRDRGYDPAMAYLASIDTGSIGARDDNVKTIENHAENGGVTGVNPWSLVVFIGVVALLASLCGYLFLKIYAMITAMKDARDKKAKAEVAEVVIVKDKVVDDGFDEVSLVSVPAVSQVKT
ncbi:hypothetical protein P280DRAFT_549906 [Massarina eburnea CBS 473.64]|uniref:Uncharacterized protein n=1 Tax=Massarina eburnea CBS 473.64 TaxID=1395130 RepID=A0A6A6S083_9PLEO|nr:hypothetical protein P280DRAFT_549906 [Massarina eburnea CBS 473.64]